MKTSMKKRRLILGMVVVVLAAIGWFGYQGSKPKPVTLTADFADTTGLYVGNQVQYLGVPIGHVTSITPEGTYMAVHMQIDHGSTIPRKALAQIMQSALLTDRYVELGPAYTGGPLLTSGATIGLGQTRSPINIDDLSRAVNDLVNALSTPGAKSAKDSNIGQLVHAVAGQLDGNGPKIHDLLVSSQAALQTLNTNSPDIAAITKNLAELSGMLKQRDRNLRNFGTGVSQATAALASQGTGLAQALNAFAQLTDQVQTFVKANKSTLVADLEKAASVTATIHGEQNDLAAIFDLMPLGSQNIVKAFDPSLGAFRVSLAARGQTVFSSIMRSATCTAYLGNLCGNLMNQQGTGPLDQIFNAALGFIPGRVG